MDRLLAARALHIDALHGEIIVDSDSGARSRWGRTACLKLPDNGSLGRVYWEIARGARSDRCQLERELGELG